MKTIRTTFTAALTVAVLAGSAMFATTNTSQAGGYYGGYGGYYKHHYTPVHCYYKKVKVWTHYGWRWKRIKVCH